MTTESPAQAAIPGPVKPDAALQEAALQEAALQEAALQEAAPQEAAPQEAAPQEAAPQEAAPQEAAPQEAAPEQAGEDVIVVPEPVVSGNPAIIALLDRARLDTVAGKREAAGASLERALRIEPRNPWLWHELAQLRLTQGQYAQAIAVAHKSISFAGRERHLQALNWRVIANARVAQGNPSDAEQAFKLAAELDQAAGPEQAGKPGQ